jgi:hypothetical protein
VAKITKSNCKYFFIFSLCILAPVFVSVGYNGEVVFNRDVRIGKEFIISFPISILFLVVFYLTKYRVKVINKPILFLFTLSLLGFVYDDFLVTRYINNIYLILFIALLLFFNRVFIAILSATDLFSLRSLERHIIIYPMLTILVISILSNITYGGKGYFLHDGIVIYNYYQYYSIIFILLLSASIKESIALSIVIFVLSLYVSYNSGNNLAYALLVFTMLSLVIVKYRIIIFRKPIYMLAIFVTAITPILYLFSLNFLTGLGLEEYFRGRFDVIHIYFDSVFWEQLFLPYFHNIVNSAPLHNEVLAIFNSSSIFGVAIYYYIVISNIDNYSPDYRLIGLSVLMIIFIGGVVVNTTLHFYTMIVLAYVISFYRVLSKYKKYTIEKAAPL